MKLFAPGYYKDFKCIADKCRHSCCIGWEVDIDSDTLKKYKDGNESYLESIRSSIEYDGTPHFKMCGGRCPHLDERGLCRIIIECGEGYLSEICREHPRFYNVTPRGCEVGLGLSCEEACRIILSSDAYLDIENIGEIDLFCKAEFDAATVRRVVYATLADRSRTYSERLEEIYSKLGVSPRETSDEEWRSVIGTLEYIDPSDRETLLSYSSYAKIPFEYDKILERFLAYLIFRHCSSCENESELRASYGFALLLERMLASILSENSGASFGEICKFARMISEEIEYSEDNTDELKFCFY